MKHTLSTVVLLLFVSGCLVARADKPNIVLVLADDMGYGDVQALNPESSIPTPNLNRLAEQGIAFTDAHTPSAVCTPTRYGQTICLTDFSATAAELHGGKLPGGAAEESYSFLPYLFGKPRPTPRPPVIHHSAAGMFAIRDGR